MKHFLILATFGIVILSGCRVSDYREMTVNVPGMASEADAQRILAALSPLNGLDKNNTTFDLSGRTVRVRYDSMQVARKNIEIAIAEAGFDANTIKAIPKATTK
jgi:copper chaperone CopZ